MSDLSLHTQKYLNRVKNFYAAPAGTPNPKIHADEVSVHLASFFEKIRNVIDYQEEHLLIKRAIERILRRRIVFSLNKDGADLAESLIFELIRSGHLPNDSVDENKIQEISFVIDRYLFVIEQTKKLAGKDRKEMQNWIFGIAACEIEDRLAAPKLEKILGEYMYEVMQNRLNANGNGKIGEEDKNIRLQLCIQKTLLKSDNVLIAYEIFKRKNPNWFSLNAPLPDDLLNQIYFFKKLIEAITRDQLTLRILRICRKHTAPFLIIGDIVSNNFGEIEEILDNPETLETEIRKYYDARYKKLSLRLKRSGFRMVLSIFISKIFIALAAEIPYDLYTSHALQPHILAISVFTPPMLMYVIVSSIKPPKEDNINEIILETMGIIYGREEKYALRTAPSRGLLTDFAFRFIYSILFVAIFSGLIWILAKLNFSVVAIGIYLAFICLIAFSGTKIRQLARELEVGKERENIITFLLDNISMPIINVGKWLSAEFSKINILVILFNFFLEIPMQSIFEFIASWRGFVDEKKGRVE